ncbi:hypothetical protein VM1G_06171 [Cytospora mali]|uniref:Uncharacterized protein n=1 Tax=Cytospora mali TaxID=578113 RepID=A0A194W137_CYTMA|nr:hypothetical protein VM1G_06171 [Valsa mali]
MSVRNLRAMFENRTQESPPDRGRSPAQSSTGTESPRPLSKVRTSFVAIEKDGRIGLQRNSSEASSISGRKLSGDTEATSSIQLDNTATNVSSPTTSRSDINRAPPSAAFAISSPQDPGNSAAGGGTSFTNPSGPPDPIPNDGPRGPTTLASGRQAVLAESPQIRQGTGRDRESEGSRSSGGRRLEPGEKTGEGEVTSGGSQGEAGTAPKGVNEGGNEGPTVDSARRGTSGGAAVTEPLNGVDKTKATKPAAGTAQRSANTPSVKPSTPASQTKPASKPSETTSRRSTTPNSEKKAAEKKATEKEHTEKTTEKKHTEKPTEKKPTEKKPTEKKPTEKKPIEKKPTETKLTEKKSTEKKLAPPNGSPGGSAKPRSKSTTRPVKLPASLTTHTAASGSKARAVSGPVGAPANTARPTSRTSSSSGTASKSMRRSSSVAGRQRPSFGPPPKLPSNDHPIPKKESKVDEGFLARMTRPTQSYANKVHEKVPVTPPRKPAAAAKKPASAKSGSARKPFSKTTSAATSAAASPETERKVAPVVEKTPIAEETITVAKREKVAPMPETPKTPEREPTIMEEKEEGIEEVPVASAVPRSSNEPEAETADAPLVNGHHKEEKKMEEPSVADSKVEIKVEEPAREPVSSGAVNLVQAQEEEEEEL